MRGRCVSGHVVRESFCLRAVRIGYVTERARKGAVQGLGKVNMTLLET